MADVIAPKYKQSITDIVDWDVDFTDAMKTGLTIASTAAVHTPPSGTASTPAPSTSGNVSTARLGPLSVTGTHKLKISATLSDGEITSLTFNIEAID
jgi:hypothetical protein